MQQLAVTAQRQSGGISGAELLFGEAGIQPWYCGVSKTQFKEFVAEVRAALTSGAILNPTERASLFLL